MTELTRTTPGVNWRDTGGGFETAVMFETGYNDRGGQHGVHGMDIRFLLRGPNGAIQFVMTTGWVPGDRGVDPTVAHLFPMGMDLGYHAHSPQRDDHVQDRRECPYLDGRPCFYDGSPLNAEPVLKAFITRGDVAVWEALREYHDSLHATILGV